MKDAGMSVHHDLQDCACRALFLQLQAQCKMSYIHLLGCELTERSDPHFESEQQQQQLLLMSWDNELIQAVQLYRLTVSDIKYSNKCTQITAVRMN